MELVSKVITERNEIQFHEMAFVRLKIYNSHNGMTKVMWNYKEDNKRIADYYAERLEKRFLRTQRKKSSIKK